MGLLRGITVASSTTGALVGNKQQPETFSSKSEDRGDESQDDARIVRALASLNSELANAQRELARRNSELAAVIREKNQLLGMAAHDLRNPLGVIVGVVDMLGEELADSLSAENRELFSRVASSAEYMLGLIDEMLDYSKIDAGRLELELHPVNVAELIRQNLAFNSILASKKRIKLRFESEGPPPILNLDSRRIQQVLNNLISNALKFAYGDTTVTVTLKSSAAEVTISVADQGQGIAADELGKLFKPFSQTRTRSTAREKSTGLGLAIVRRIVEAHGGSIRVESELGRGSTFYVSLPAVAPEAASIIARLGRTP
jgi:two-component system, OmpR family, sensor kinase